jgi:hypothetical protein
MQNSLISELLAVFSPAEKRAFTAFLHRPERKVRDDVRKLGTILVKSVSITSEKAHTSLFAGQGFNRQHINQLASWLYREAKAFLLESHYLQAGNEIPLITEFNRRKLPRQRDRLISQLDKQSLGNLDLPFQNAIHDTIHHGSRSTDINLQQINDLLDVAFIREKLRQACLMVSHQTVTKVTYETGLLEAVLAFVQERSLAEDPHTGIYLSAYHFLSNPESEDPFYRFLEQLTLLPITVPSEERRDLYLLGINYCIRQTNRGSQVMAREALKLYRAGLSDGSLLENGQLTTSTYRNALALSLKVKDFAWGESFTEQYAEYLPPAQRENVYRYNRARLAHARSNPEEALEELRFVRSDNVLFTLTLDTFRAKIYYETGAYDLLSAHLDKMAIFLRRKDSSYHHRNYGNFIALLTKTLHLPPGPKKRQQLRETIADEPILTERAWLLEVIGR